MSAVEPTLSPDDLGFTIDDRTVEILERRRGASVVKRRGWLVRRALAAADIAGLTLAFLVAQAAFGAGTGLQTRLETVLFLLTLPGWIVAAKLYGLYDRDEERADHSTPDDMVAVFHMVTVGAWLFFAGTWATGLAEPQMRRVFAFWLIAVALVAAGRAAARAFCRRRVSYLQNTIVVGAGDVGQLVARKLLRHPEYGINLVGFVDTEPSEEGAGVEHVAFLGRPAELPLLIDLLDVERVIVAFTADSHERTIELVRSLQDLDVQIDVVPRLHELVGPGVGLHAVEGMPLLGLPPSRLSRSSALLKRCMDLILASIALALLAPLMALIALAIMLDSPGPVFFRQVRMGAGDRTFRIFKFRTMVVDAERRKSALAHMNKHAGAGGDPRMFKIENDPRVTRVGRWLRRSSLDELPQLLNVLRGEMSLVGPRPLILDEDQHVDAWGRKRLALKPGMTGLWQVLGSSAIPFEEMVTLDYRYVTSWSPWGDLRLLLRTAPLVVRRANGAK